MQGSNSIPEDLRQSPYLCPIDNAKLDFLIAARGDKTKVGEEQRERALLHFVTGHNENGGGFAASRAWLEARLAHEDTQISSYSKEQMSGKTVPSNPDKRKPVNDIPGGPRRSRRVASRSFNA